MVDRLLHRDMLLNLWPGVGGVPGNQIKSTRTRITWRVTEEGEANVQCRAKVTRRCVDRNSEIFLRKILE